MDNSIRLTSPSLGELLDRLSINQIKEVLDPANRLAYSQGIKEIEHDIDLFIVANRLKFDAYFIRLIISLSQINLYIWQTKEIMQAVPGRFKKSMKFVHQLNGIRNQIKNMISEEAGLTGQAGRNTNIDTDNLKGWTLGILEGRRSIESSRRSILKEFKQEDSKALPDKKIRDKRKYKYSLSDLIDNLTIAQIKEALLPKGQHVIYNKEMLRFSCDIDQFLDERQIRPTARLARLIVFLAQANLHIWHNKDKMQNEPKRYYELLEFAQELNGLRNFVKNLLMKEMNESGPCNQKATFLEYTKDKWYSVIIEGMNDNKGMPVLSLAMNDFARLLGTTIDDIPAECLKIISNKDFRYRKLDMDSRDQVLNRILKKIDSGKLWVSGSDKQAIWEQGWSENLKDYEDKGDIAALTPKFLQNKQVLRLNRDYMQPLSSDFEFNFVEVYRRWAFRKYLKDAQSIYEFGCGSCQHLPVLAELFPDKKLHGLDWAAVSTKIIEKLVNEKGWNITSHVFDLYSPDANLILDDNCAVFTIGTMEQLGKRFEPFLKFLLRKHPSIVMHMESIGELYDESYLTDHLALRYDGKRNYLQGYLERLRQLEQDRKIKIIKVHRVFFGSMYHDSYSLVVWTPRYDKD